MRCYDVNDIADKMLWYIENPEEGKQLGEKAHIVVKDKYDSNIILQKNLAFYKQIIGRS